MAFEVFVVISWHSVLLSSPKSKVLKVFFSEDILVLNQDYYVQIDNSICKMENAVQILKCIICLKNRILSLFRKYNTFVIELC